jgi:hypothetical protein
VVVAAAAMNIHENTELSVRDQQRGFSCYSIGAGGGWQPFVVSSPPLRLGIAGRVRPIARRRLKLDHYYWR